MRKLIAPVLLLALSSPPLFTAPPDSAEIDRLIQQLGSQRFTQREAAQRALDQIGEPAYVALVRATSSEDLEIRKRSTLLVESIGRRVFGEVRRFEGHTATVLSVAVSADGKRVLSGSEDKTARVWEMATGKEVRALTSSGMVFCVAFSSDGNQALSSTLGSATLWNLRSGKEVQEFEGGETWMEAALFRPGQRQIVTVGKYATAVLWDTQTGDSVRSYTSRTQMTLRLAISPDGKRLLSASGFRPSAFDSPRLWDVDTGKELLVLDGHDGPVRGLAFAPNGKQVATSSTDGTIRLWDPATGKETAQLTGHQGTVTGVNYTPDGKRLVSAGDDRTVRVWEPQTGRELHSFIGHEGSVHSVACTPDGKYVLSGSADKTVRLWRLPPVIASK